MKNLLCLNITSSMLVVLLGNVVQPTYAEFKNNNKYTANILKNVVIHKRLGKYSAFPEIYRTRNGNIVISLSERKTNTHYDDNQSSIKYVSFDNGQTWNRKNSSDINANFYYKNSLVSFPYVNGWKTINRNESIDKYKNIDIHTDKDRKYFSIGANYSKSIDGVNWEKHEIKLPSHKMIMTHNLSGYLKVNDDFGIRSFYIKTANERDVFPIFVATQNGGVTWEYLSSIKTTDEFGFDEVALANIGENKILALMRPSPTRNGYLFQSLSSNSGSTWSDPVETDIDGYPPNIVTTTDKIVISYGHRKFPMGIRVSIQSKDTLVRIIPDIILRNDHDSNARAADVGYPSTLNLENDYFITVYYITIDGTTQVEATYWHLENIA